MTPYHRIEMSRSRLSHELSAKDRDTAELLSSEQEDSSHYYIPNPPKKTIGFWFWALTFFNAILFPLSLVCAFSAFQWKHALQNNHGNALVRLTSWYSPVFDQTHINVVDKKINGSLLNIDNNIFRQPPSPEVDEAWERISSLSPHVISTDDVVRLGKDPSTTAKWPLDWGFGPDAHVGELDILHTIHCLNAIRRDVYWRHYFIDLYPDGIFPELHRVHTDHCIHVVLQNLMCSATPDMITQPWVDGQLHPFPDFSINKKCHDFDAILAWHEKTMIADDERYAQIRMPEGHTPLPMSDEFHRMFGSEQTVGHDHTHLD